MSKSIPRISVTLPNGAAAGVLSNAITVQGNTGVYQGVIILLKVVTPNFTNAITVRVAVYDANGIQKFLSDALAENSGAAGRAVYPAWPGIPIESGEYIGVTPSGDPGAGGGIVTVDMEFVPDAHMRI